MRKYTKTKALMAGIFCAAAMMSLSGGIAYAADDSDTVITNDESGIPDEKLYNVVLEKGDKNKDGVLTRAEAEEITYINCIDYGIKDIRGLQFLNNLQDLSLVANNISDISSLKDLTNINGLDLSNNNITDISSLVNLHLNSLNLENNQISDISALKDSELIKNMHVSNSWEDAFIANGKVYKKYKIANGNMIPLEQAKILPEELINAKVYRYDTVTTYMKETDKIWLDTEFFVDPDRNGVVIWEDGSIHYYKDGIEDSAYTGMEYDNSTGAKYWFDSGIAARDKQVYDPGSDAWYWFDADGTMAVNKDVYVPESNENRENGKWVRYDENGAMVKGEEFRYGGWYRFDEITGEMIKGWYTTQDGRTYYYNEITGQMEHGSVVIGDMPCAFDNITGIAVNCGWYTVDGNEYWYENGIRQGMEGRGKEIYDPASDAWYWLDAVDGGKKATSKDVYQESSGGKWVRYDENGHMIKGWNEQNGNIYYFDLITGAMLKGDVRIGESAYHFNEITGILEEKQTENYEEYVGTYYKEGDSASSMETNGGTSIEIQSVSGTNVKFTITSISSAPSNRIASVTGEGTISEDGTVDYTYNDDYWGNSGNGTLLLKDNRIILSNHITGIDSSAMWMIHEYDAEVFVR